MAKAKPKIEGLLDVLVEELTGRIQSGNASPKDLDVARQLLKDNQIQARPDKHKGMVDLTSALPFTVNASDQN